MKGEKSNSEKRKEYLKKHIGAVSSAVETGSELIIDYFMAVLNMIRI